MVYVASMLHEVSSMSHLVKPVDDGSYVNENAHPLDYYITNSDKYFTSNTILQFLPGLHNLQNDFVVQNINNFTVSGNHTIIQCYGLAIALVALNVIDLTICDIELINCGRSVLKGDHEITPNNHTGVDCNGVIYLSHCATVLISDVTITANVNVSGVVAINAFETEFVDVKISTSCHNPHTTSSPVKGIGLYYSDHKSDIGYVINYTTETTIMHYSYLNNGLCNSSYALYLVLIQELYNVFILVQNSNFTEQHNSSVLYYYGESCGQYIDNNITFQHCTIKNNAGSMLLNMFHILIHSDGYIISRVRHPRKCDKQWNMMTFNNCHFVNNLNINSLLYFDLKNTLLFNALVDIQYCNFLFNKNVQILMVDSEVKVITQLSHYIYIMETNISSNRHDNLVNMISSTNGRIHVENVVITNNTYEHILTLYLSVLIYENYLEISSNFARFLIRAEEVSYYILKEYSTIKIANNLVYASITTAPVYTQHLNK